MEEMNTLEKLIAGLQILNKYPDKNVAAGHDEISAGDCEETSPEDKAALEELGWTSEEYDDCWTKFV